MKFGETDVYESLVQFEDIDMGGVVHHPNYLKFYERARTSAMDKTGYTYTQFWQTGLAMAVAEAYLSYRKPLRLYQKIFVCSRIVGVLKGNIKVAQAILGSYPSKEALQSAGDDLNGLPDLFHHGLLRLVCVDLQDMKIASMPEPMVRAFGIPSDQDRSETSRKVRIFS